MKSRGISLLLVCLFAFMLLPITAYASTLISGPANPQVFEIGKYRHTLEYSARNPNLHIYIQNGSLPPGITHDKSFHLHESDFRGTALPGTAGTYPITVAAMDDTVTLNVTIEVIAGPQTIVQGNISKKMSDGIFTVTPQSTDGNGNTIDVGAVSPSLVALHQPTYTFSGNTNPAVATIDGSGNVTLVGPGTTTVTVNSAATDSYLVATNNGITFDIIVSKADPTITASNQTATLGAAKIVTATLPDAYLAGGDSITFTAASGTVSATTTATANGSVSFNLSAADINTLGLGAHTFTISQTSMAGSAATNNNTVANASFTLTVNAPIIAGASAPSALPKTGDGFPLGGLLAMMGVMLASAGWLGLRLRKQRWGA